MDPRLRRPRRPPRLRRRRRLAHTGVRVVPISPPGKTHFGPHVGQDGIRAQKGREAIRRERVEGRPREADTEDVDPSIDHAKKNAMEICLRFYLGYFLLPKDVAESALDCGVAAVASQLDIVPGGGPVANRCWGGGALTRVCIGLVVYFAVEAIPH